MLSSKHWKTRPFFRLTTYSILLAFGLNILGPLPKTYAQVLPELGLPNPGMMIGPSVAFVPVILRGIKVHPDNPFQFDFIVDTGNEFPPSLTIPTEVRGNSKLKEESTKLIKYFLAALTVPEDDLWVNLSPYEKDRIIPEAFGQTEMGRDLLAQDYILKQLTASLMYPENDLGKEFWQKVYQKAQEKYGTSEIPINTFNKVWIVPDKAEVYETEDTAFVTESHLKVMLEVDYLALQNNLNKEEIGTDQLDSQDVEQLSDVSSQIVKEIILPAIEVEVNEGKNFAQLRQIYNSLILAAWFKRALKDSILNKIYTDQNKIAGVDIEDKEVKQKIYNQYLEAFKKGVYDYIKEDYDPATQEIIARRYFSGGVGFNPGDFGGGIKGALKRHPMARSGQSERSFLQKITAVFRGTAILVKSEFNTGNTPKFAQAFADLENGYRNILKGILSPVDSQFDKILDSRYELEKQYGEMDKTIRGFLSKKDLQGTFLAKVLEEYQKEIEAVHQEYREWLTVYISLIWPNGKKNKNFKEFSSRTETIWKKWNEGENLQLKELARLRIKRDNAQSLTDQKRLSRQLIQDAQRVLLSQINSGPKARLQDQFRLSLYTETILDLMGEVSVDPKLENVFKKFFPSPLSSPQNGEDKGEGVIKQRVRDWVYGYAPDISQDEKDVLEKAIAVRIGKEVRKIEGQKSFRQWMRTMAISLGMVSLLLPLSGEADVTPKNFEEKSAVEATVEDGPGNKTEESQESAVEIPQTPVAPLPLAVLFQSLAASLPEVSEPSLGVSEEVSQAKAIEANIQEIQQALVALKAQQVQVDQETQALKASAQNELDTLLAQANDLKSLEDSQEIGGVAQKAQELKEPDEWQKPESPKPEELKGPEGEKISPLVAPSLPLKELVKLFAESVSEDSQGEADTREKLPSALRTTFGPSKVNLGDGNMAGTGPVFAKVQGGNSYLQIGQYSWVDPIRGRFFNQESQFNLWNLDAEGNFAEYVLMKPQADKQVLLYIPSGYVVSGLLTEKGVGQAAVYYDTVNGVWMAVFDQAPGSLKIGVRPAQGQELKEFPAMQILDGEGNILQREKALEVIQQNVPETLWEILQISKNVSKETQQEIVKEILGLFYYSTNPYFNDSQFRGNTILDTTFRYFAGECQGLSNLRWMIAYVLDQPMLIASGYLDTDSDGMFTSGMGHQWNRGEEGIEESTAGVEMVSPLWGKSDVSPKTWQNEMAFLAARGLVQFNKLKGFLLKLQGDKIRAEMRVPQEQLTRIAQESPKERAQQQEVQRKAKELKAAQEYYAKAMAGYEQQLEQLRAAPMDQGSANAFLTQVEQLNLQNTADRYQLMSYGHYLFEALAIIDGRFNGANFRDEEYLNGETGHLRIQRIKNNLFVRIAKLAKSKGWALIEPSSSDPIFLHGGEDHEIVRNVTDFQGGKITRQGGVINFGIDGRNGSNKVESVSVLADVLTGEQIDQDVFLTDYVPGLQIWYDGILKEVKLRGARTNSEGDLVYRRIRSLHILGPGPEDWLVDATKNEWDERGDGVMSEVQGLFGPMARKLSIEGEWGDVVFMDMNNWVVYGYYKNTQKHYLFGKGELYRYFLKEEDVRSVSQPKYFDKGQWAVVVAHNESIEMVVEESTIRYFFRSYTGSAAEKEGWIGQKFMEARDPIQTPRGNFIAKVKDSSGWRFIGSGLAELQRQEGSGEQISQQRFKDEPDYPVFFPDGEWLLLDEFIGATQVFQEPIKRSVLRGSEKMMRDVRKLLEINEEVIRDKVIKIYPIQTAPNGKWIGRIDLAGNETIFWGPLAEEAGLVKDSSLIRKFQKLYKNERPIGLQGDYLQPVILDNNEFYIVYFEDDPDAYSHGRYFFTGTWAKSQGLEGFGKGGTKFRKTFANLYQPFFAENLDGSKDYSRWVIVDEGAVAYFFGPLVGELGLPTGMVFRPADEQPLVTKLVNGNVLFKWKDDQGEHSVSLRPFDADRFLTRAAARYDITAADSESPVLPTVWDSLPERRIDQRLEYLALLSEELSRSAQDGSDAPFFNPAFLEQFSSLIKYMIENFSTHFFDAEQVEAHLRRILFASQRPEGSEPVDNKTIKSDNSMTFDIKILPSQFILETEGTVEPAEEDIVRGQNFYDLLFSLSNDFNSRILRDIFPMLRMYGLNSFGMELSLALDEFARSHSLYLSLPDILENFRSLLTPEEWQDNLESYLERLRENLPGNILVDSQDFATPELSEQVEALNKFVLSLADEETRLSLTEYQEHLAKVRTFLEGTQIPHAKRTEIPREYLTAVFDFIHEVTDDSMPFDAEVSGDLLDHPLYAMARILHHDPAELKVGADREETAKVQSRYERWQEMNDQLNGIFKSSVGGKDDTSFFPLLIDDISHDGLALAMILWALMFPATWMTKAVEKRDWFVRHNGRNSIRKIWDKNAFGIRGEGLGDQEGEREILARLMIAGALMTDAQKAQLEELRESMDDRGKAVIDAIRLIALDFPSQAVETQRSRLWTVLVPYLGPLLLSKRGSLRNRAALNSSLVEFTRTVNPDIALNDFYKGLKEVVERQVILDAQPKTVSAENLPTPEEFHDRLQAAIGKKALLRTDGREIKRSGINGVSVAQQGRGEEFEETREYQPGDDVRFIDASISARMGKPMVKQYRQQGEIAVDILVDMRTLGQTDIDQWIEELIQSVNVLNHENRFGRHNPANYTLSNLIFLMPDHRAQELRIGQVHRVNGPAFLNMVLRHVERVYRKAREEITGMVTPDVQVKEASFYTEEENERYRARTEDVFEGLDQSAQAQKERLEKTLSALGTRRKNAFLVGAAEENLAEISGLSGKTPKAQMYYWEGQRAVRLRSAQGSVDSAALGEETVKGHPAARAADSGDPAALDQQNPGGSPSANLTKGGIDVRMTEDVLKTKGEGVRFDVPSNLQNFDPNFFSGLTPIIFEMNIIPLQQLPGILLGVGEEEKDEDLSLLEVRFNHRPGARSKQEGS